ncbi:hypothetical protein T03_6664 [Trichinella britovi]|uniref:EGF-like domain-containing protein n=1 Tax=Trichinella britovi TaxID=45882 RepID=A0A0V1D901_TRIBR|nr:hypothetical protein T03_6664 [Trichinella britovi]
MSTNLNTEIRKAFSGWPLVLNCQSNGANQDKESVCWWFQQNNQTYLIPSNNATLAIIEKANLTLLTVSPEISGYHFICGYQERALRRFEIKVMLCNDDDPCNGRGNCLTYQNDKIAPIVYCKCKDKYFGTFCTEHIPIQSFVKMTIINLQKAVNSILYEFRCNRAFVPNEDIKTQGSFLPLFCQLDANNRIIQQKRVTSSEVTYDKADRITA